MIDAFEFSNKAETEQRERLEQLQNLIAFSVLGNTERGMLRKLAENGGPLDLIMQGLLAYDEQLRYTIGKLDLEDRNDLARAVALVRERKFIDFTKRLFERVLTPLPEEAKQETKS